MSKKLFNFVLIGFLFVGSVLQAQNGKPTMKFDSKEYDFGTFKEETGKITHSFEFVNTGNQPIIINNVRSSCGCTSPDWSRKPVAPGQKGFIKATFDPRNRPGQFNKTVTVTANTSPSVNILRIKGKVIPRVKTVKDLYPQEMAGLRLKSRHLSFTRVKNSDKKEASLKIVNTSEEPLRLTFNRVPAHLTIKTEPEVLKPNEKGEIVAVYDASKKHDWGFVIDYVDLKINDVSNPRHRLTVSATIEEDFNNMTEEQKAQAPKVEFKEKVFDFGQLNQGEKAEHVFVMRNSGKSDLIIRKTKASCGCTAISPLKKVIQPGEQTEIKVVFNSRGKRGRQNKMITVITNDPLASIVRLRVTGNVKMPRTN
ncbi:MAG: DUF1573 domain-containing protein [Marinifilaceae bacterium]